MSERYQAGIKKAAGAQQNVGSGTECFGSSGRMRVSWKAWLGAENNWQRRGGLRMLGSVVSVGGLSCSMPEAICFATPASLGNGAKVSRGLR